MQEDIENREEYHMEEHNGNSRQGKKKFGVIGTSTRGGGIEKAIALGGALAVAGLIAAFSITKSSKRDNNKNNEDKMNVSAQDTVSCAKEEDAGEGIPYILHQNSCCTGMTETETSESVSTQSLITLDSVSDQQETLVHDAKQESNEMNRNLENESNVIANLEMETFEITIVDKEMDVDAKQPTLQSSISREDDEKKEYSPMRSSFSIDDDPIGEEEDYSPKESTFSTEEDENGENVSEMDEESSEGTWSSSPEPTNMEVIWPAEMMDMNVSNLESEMKYKEEGIKGKVETYHYAAKTTFDGKTNKKVTEEVVVMDIRKEQHSARRQTWVWFGLVALMLGLLANILLQSNYLSNNVSFVFPMK